MVSLCSFSRILWHKLHENTLNGAWAPINNRSMAHNISRSLFIFIQLEYELCWSFDVYVHLIGYLNSFLNSTAQMFPSSGRQLETINPLRPRQNGRHFTDDILKCIFLNENVWIPFEISLKFVPKGPIDNIPAMVQIMAWRRPGDKPLSEPMMVNLLTYICVTRPQWV